MTFAEFSAANRKRCQEAFGRKVDPTSAVAFVLGVAEEAGEVSGAVRGHLGITKRKAATTVEDIGAEIADLVQYADLLAACFGLELERVLVAKFNHVSERIGSPVKLAASPGESPRGEGAE